MYVGHPLSIDGEIPENLGGKSRQNRATGNPGNDEAFNRARQQRFKDAQERQQEANRQRANSQQANSARAQAEAAQANKSSKFKTIKDTLTKTRSIRSAIPSKDTRSKGVKALGGAAITHGIFSNAKNLSDGKNVVSAAGGDYGDYYTPLIAAGNSTISALTGGMVTPEGVAETGLEIRSMLGDPSARAQLKKRPKIDGGIDRTMPVANASQTAHAQTSTIASQQPSAVKPSPSLEQTAVSIDDFRGVEKNGSGDTFFGRDQNGTPTFTQAKIAGTEPHRPGTRVGGQSIDSAVSAGQPIKRASKAQTITDGIQDLAGRRTRGRTNGYQGIGDGSVVVIGDQSEGIGSTTSIVPSNLISRERLSNFRDGYGNLVRPETHGGNSRNAGGITAGINELVGRTNRSRQAAQSNAIQHRRGLERLSEDLIRQAGKHVKGSKTYRALLERAYGLKEEALGIGNRTPEQDAALQGQLIENSLQQQQLIAEQLKGKSLKKRQELLAQYMEGSDLPAEQRKQIMDNILLMSGVNPDAVGGSGKFRVFDMPKYDAHGNEIGTAPHLYNESTGQVKSATPGAIDGAGDLTLGELESAEPGAKFLYGGIGYKKNRAGDWVDVDGNRLPLQLRLIEKNGSVDAGGNLDENEYGESV